MVRRTGMPYSLNRWSRFIIMGLCLSLSFPGSAQDESRAVRTTGTQEDEAAVRALANEFFSAYSKKDPDAFIGLWSEKSPEVRSRRQAIEQMFANCEKIDVKDTTIQELQVKGERAKLRVAVSMSATYARTGKPASIYGNRNRSLEFVKEGAIWKVWSEVAPEDELALRLATAKTEEERAALLAKEEYLLIPALTHALVRQGNQLRFQEDYPRALAIFHLAQTIAERIGHKAGVANALAKLGLYHYTQGDYAKAWDYSKESLRLWEEEGNNLGVAALLEQSGTLCYEQGNYSLALEYLLKTLALYEELRLRLGIADVLSRIGDVYSKQSNYAQALEYFQKSLALGEALKSTILIAGALNNIAGVYRAQGNYSLALEYQQKNLTLLERLGHKSGIAFALSNIGLVYLDSGKYAQALEHHQKALALFETMGYTQGMVDSLNNIGAVYLAQGGHTQALEYADRSAALARQFSHPAHKILSARAIAGLAYRALNRPSEARLAFEEVITIIETMRAQVAGGEQDQQRFFEDKVLAYDLMVEFLIQEKNHSEALAYAERAKGRVLLDVLRSGRVNVTKAMTAQEQERERMLNADLASLNGEILRESQRSQPDQGRLTDVKARLQKARLNRESFETSLYAAHPKLKVQRGEVPALTLAQATDLLPDAKGALLEYVVTDEKTYLFVVTSNQADNRHRTQDTTTATRNRLPEPVLKVYELNIKRKDLSDRVDRFGRRLANRDRDFHELASELYNLLIKPAGEQLQGKTMLVIVPDNVLWHLPFQALQPTESHYLIEDCAISYTPSLTVLREMVSARQKETERTTASPKLLALGNPSLNKQTVDRVKSGQMDEKLESLPEAERQVKRLGQLYGAARSRVYVGAQAREDVLKSEAHKYQILHLATHGILNDASPMYSQVLLTQSESGRDDDGLLEAWEIMRLDLKAKLVVLSACETARGRVGAGEGMIGLTWAFFVAGCPAMVASQWKVESASTTELMLEFHRNLESARLTKAEALRQAELKLLRSERYSHPFFWAGFEVVGDGFWFVGVV